jgi:hypothetical protein
MALLLSKHTTRIWLSVPRSAPRAARGKASAAGRAMPARLSTDLQRELRRRAAIEAHLRDPLAAFP